MSSLTARRFIAAAVCAGFIVIAVVLLFADRSSALVPQVQRAIVSVGRQIESTLNIDFIDRSDIPGTTDQFGHAALWGMGMALAGWFGRHRLPVALTALFMAAASLVVEILQPLLSASRKFQPSDVVGNIAGIAVAALLVALVIKLRRVKFRELRSTHPADP